MGKVEVNKTGRAAIAVTSQGLVIEIPAKKNILILGFVAIWLTMWTIGGFTAIGQVFSENAGPDRAFLIFWLCGWAAGEVFAVLIVTWNLSGREVIEMTAKSLIHKRQVFGLGPIHEYDLSEVRNVRLSTGGSPFNMSQGLEFWGIGGGTLSFDYGLKTFRVGSGLEEAEATQLIEKMQKVLPKSLMSAN